MRFLLAFLFLIAFQNYTRAQNTDNPAPEIMADTIEGSSTDTSIVYIIKKAPITIKERVEIERARIKKNFYFTLGFSTLVNSNTYKANSGYDDYVEFLNTKTKAEPGYGGLIQLCLAPKKTIFGITLEGHRMHESIMVQSSDGQETMFQNSYTYAGAGITIGKWMRKEKKVSFQLVGIPMVYHTFGLSGYSLDKTERVTNYIAEDVAYKKNHFGFLTTFKVLYKMRNSFVELAPFFVAIPFSMTKKTEAFSIKRSCIGIQLNITNKLF